MNGSDVGEPKGWDAVMLKSWLVKYGSGREDPARVDALSHEALAQRVTNKLNALFNDYLPSYSAPFQGIDLSTLPQWVPGRPTPRAMLPGLGRGGSAFWGGEEEEEQATTLESELVKSSYSIQERMANRLGQPPSFGQHPLDDYRQYLCVHLHDLDRAYRHTFVVTVRSFVCMFTWYSCHDKVAAHDHSSDACCTKHMRYKHDSSLLLHALMHARQSCKPSCAPHATCTFNVCVCRVTRAAMC